MVIKMSLARKIILSILILVSMIYCNNNSKYMMKVCSISEMSRKTHELFLPNSYSFSYIAKNWDGTLYYGYNGYFTQRPTISVEILIKTKSILGQYGIFASYIQNRGIGILKMNKEIPPIYYYNNNDKKYLITELSTFGHNFDFLKYFNIDASTHFGLVHNIDGKYEPMPYVRVPLNIKLVLRDFSVGFGWDYYYDNYLGGVPRAINGRYFLEYSF